MDKNVTIYSTPTCHFCHMTKDFLKEKGIGFTDYNVASDLEKRQEMIQKSGQMGVPVILVGDELKRPSACRQRGRARTLTFLGRSRQ